MSLDWKEVAETCMGGAYSGALSFPQIVGKLTESGVDGYAVDFRAGTATYYLASTGEAVTFDAPKPETPVAEAFLADVVKEAIQEAQLNAEGYTYRGFCNKVASAGCEGYLVSITGRRVLYIGRTGETHTELFPN